jgi:hypothetical protein
MLIIRLIFVLLGFLLLRRLFGPWGQPKRRGAAPTGDAGQSADAAPPFADGEIQDGEFEDLDRRRGAGGGSS